ncbi:hypothetical protein [Pelagicoccus sp. SDUM812003]|uniref:hypothetical protein n=1 Tax=Pelagicoccus sp. SDUM812003 TaxID=3041267 RepID=UPI00280E0628|nr:hypothetical protein [Pelagicoccus sp. SDUM812003]MDQ8201586.1 hypothetical protein [Pelagicoccus sp. SDUM812003]
MLDYQKLLQARLPEALESALESIDRAFDRPEQLLQADVSLFEDLGLCVFAYFNRDDIFYLNKAGRQTLKLKLPTVDSSKSASTPPIFWLENELALAQADALVTQKALPLFNVRELVTLSWGKTWFEGAKFPIRNAMGQPLAILFAGRELPPSKQIRQVAKHYELSQQKEFGEN